MVSHHHIQEVRRTAGAAFVLFTFIIAFALAPITFTDAARGDRTKYSEKREKSSRDSYTPSKYDPSRDVNKVPEGYPIETPKPVSSAKTNYEPSVSKKTSSKKGDTVSMRDLGLLQLAAHDFFDVDRNSEVDRENGKLDLSTLLDRGDEFIAIGGEPRNRENILIFSVAKWYGERYLNYLERGYSEEEARAKVVKRYHKELKSVYEEIFNEDMPEAREGVATMTENLALRTIHDLLPGQVRIGTKTVMTVDPSLIGKHLSNDEMKDDTDDLNGEIDEVFREVAILIPPSTILFIDLLERDSSFADQFNTEHSFEHFMGELEDGEYNHDEDVMKHIRNLFAKGLYF